MTFWAYILHCSDKNFCVGHTDNLEGRIGQHDQGQIPGYTHKRRPVELVWSQDFPSRYEALAAERQIKGWSRAKKQALIAGDWEQVSVLSRKSFDTGFRQAQSLLRTNGNEGTDTSPSISSSPPPLIILVRPQLGENIGKAARAMLNFGLTELRLVAPRDGWPNPSAGPASAGADIVLEQAEVFANVADATADCAHVYATTVRKRGVVKPVLAPDEAARAIRNDVGRSAILFGAERSGLESDEVALARSIITVPINPAFSSLNLAQAVILIAYEWSKGEALASPPKVDLDPPAPQEELEGMIGQLDAMLESAGHFLPPHRAHIDRRTIRSILTKPGWSAQEVRTLRGVLRSLGVRPPRDKKG
jgi:tRNA/rRNA methyltransferase